MIKNFLLLAGCLLIALLAGGWVRQNGGDEAGDTKKILAFADEQMQSGYSIILKWGGRSKGYASDSQFIAMSQSIGRIFIPDQSGELQREGQVPLYRITSEKDGLGQLMVLVSGSDDGQSSFVIVKLQADANIDPNQLLDWQRRTTGQLKAAGLSGGSWDTMAQGMALSGKEGADLPHKFEVEAEAAFVARPSEYYSDAETASVTMFADKLGKAVHSGVHDVNLQVAAHKVSTDGEWRLTVGAPIITSEY